MGSHYQELFELIFDDSEGCICLAYIDDIKKPKDQQRFYQVFYLWPKERQEIFDWIKRHKSQDCYFCPHLLSEPHRRKEYALPSHTLYADLDDCHPGNLKRYGEPSPSIIVQTSSEHWQAYWLLNEPLAPAEYERLNQRIAYAYADLGCDRSGWDLGQLLRVPGTTNNKKAPFTVDLSIVPPASYTGAKPTDFNCLSEVSAHSSNVAVSFSEGLPEVSVKQLKASNKIKSYILNGWSETSPYKSRSELDIAVINALVAKGYSDDVIKAIFMRYAIGEKYREQGDVYLKHQIAAAREYVSTKKKEEKMPDNNIIETSFVELQDGTIAEQILNPGTKEVSFAVCNNDMQITYESQLEFEGKVYKPIDDELVSHKVVLFPSEAIAFGSIGELLANIQSFIHKYLDVRDYFEKLCSYYVLLSWVYDAFNVLPYLRFLGGWSTGKSRALETIGAICYKPMRLSGATSISSIFRVLEKFAGTLIIDEADHSRGDEFAEFVKILNTGYQKDVPLLRAEKIKSDRFEPRPYRVFGPKVVATRRKYTDQALESRMLTERMDRGFDKIRIPLSLPAEFYTEALGLRNKLLYYRLTQLKTITPGVVLAQPGIEPRITQVLAALNQLIDDPTIKQELQELAYKYTATIQEDRSVSLDGEVVASLFELLDESQNITVKDVYDMVVKERGGDADTLSPRKVGQILRGLGLTLVKRSRGFTINTEASKEAIDLLKRQYCTGKENSGGEAGGGG